MVDLSNKRVAILVANSGVEQVELTQPREALEAAGATTVLVAPEEGKIQAFTNDVEPADSFSVDATVAEVAPAEFDLLLLPGGTTNPDTLRTIPEAVALVKGFVDAGRSIAAVCHGPWMLVEADVLNGKTLTSWPSLQTDIRNARGTWVDQEVFVCPANGWTLVTSRNPDDLEAFSGAIIDLLS